MGLPDWVYIVGILIVNIFLIVLICVIVFKHKDADIEIQKEIFNQETQNEPKEEIVNPNLSEIKEVYEAMKKDSEIDRIQSFEQEQEETAIISYQELLKLKQEQENKTVQKKFPKTEVISPIYGRMEEIVEEKPAEIKEENFELEKTLNIEPIKKEIKETEEFLNALKDFRKNL